MNILKRIQAIVPKLKPVCLQDNSLYKFHHINSILKNRELINCRNLVFNGSVSRSFYCCSRKYNADVPKSDNNPPDEHLQKALDDKEFKNILRDFSKDFEVGSDAEKILEDIKINIENTNEEKIKETDKDDGTNQDKNDRKTLNLYDISAQEKFREFEDKDATIIYSYEEELLGLNEQKESTYHITQEEEIKCDWKAMKRGISGVFDIEELVDVLRKENLLDISVIRIPKVFSYVDYMVLVTAKSPRHSRAVSEFLIKLYKAKKHEEDPFLKIEGEKTPTWKAIDMGNIVLHIFLKEIRATYDIESLWLFDTDFDSGGSVQVDPALQTIEEQMAFFTQMDPSSVDTVPKLLT